MMALFALARLLDHLGDRYPIDFGRLASAAVDRLRRRLQVPRVIVIVLPRELDAPAKERLKSRLLR